MKFIKKIFSNELAVVIISIALFVGLVGISIGRFSIWHDESYSATLIESNYSGIIERTGKDVHPPLYYILLKTWSLIFGDSILALRLFSSVVMLGAIVLTWQLIRKLYGPEKAKFALLIMSMGPFLVRYGQEMRMYGLVALLAIIATHIYVYSIGKTKLPIRYAVAYGFILAAGIYTQYFFILVPIAHFAHLAFAAKKSNKNYLAAVRPYLFSALTAVLLFAPWVPTVYKQYSEVQGAFWIGPVSVETLTSTPIAMTIFQKQYEATRWMGLLAGLSLATVLVLLINFRKNHKDSKSNLLILSVVLPPVVLFALSLPPFQPSYQDRYMSFLAPIFYSVLALGALTFKKPKIKFAVSATLITVLAFGQYYQFRDGNNHGWNPKPTFTMNEIASSINDGSPVYSTSLWTFFDAHITLKNKIRAGEVKLLTKDYPTYDKGNWSAVYGRSELFATTIPDEVDELWLIDEANPQYFGNALNEYLPVEKQNFGYATLTKYVKK